MSEKNPPGSAMSSAVKTRLEPIIERFEEAWQRGEQPSIDSFLAAENADRHALLVELVHVDLERRLKTGEAARIEDYLHRYPELTPHSLLPLIVVEYELRRQEPGITVEEYCRRFPQHQEQLRQQLTPPDNEKPQQETVAALPSPNADPFATVCKVENLIPPRASEVDPASALAKRIGRYRVVKVLGKGAFGRVYLAEDDELHRPVAIKVPHRHRIAKPEDAETFLAEARFLASLDHPHIVPVFDVGRTDDGLCFVVSKYIEGSDLAQKIKEHRPSFSESAALVAVIAESLHYAHRKGLVHRDIKPANILIDKTGKAYVADFGLALKEEEFGKGMKFAGTPAYMSPEQARREGHRVDGRSDIFSLGVVFYELLTGRRPFQADTLSELLDQIKTVEARPPRQIDDAIPRELERICLKALSKRVTERYTTATDMGGELCCFRESPEGKRLTGPEAVATPVPARSEASSREPTEALGVGPMVMLTYTRPDADLALSLWKKLVAHGIPVWMDRVNGLPGEKDWWTQVTSAMTNCTHMLALVSTSAIVTKVIKVTWMARKQIIPVLIDDAVLPEELAEFQGAAVRTQELDEAIQHLRRVLPQSRSPKHWLVGSGVHPGFGGACEIEAAGKNILVNPYAYISLQALLDDLFVHYLYDQFNPYTYGSDWVLLRSQSKFGSLIAAPMEWMRSPGTAIQQLNATWAELTLPTQVGLFGGTSWQVADRNSFKRYAATDLCGVVTNNINLIDPLLHDFEDKLHNTAIFSVKSAEDNDWRRYHFSFIRTLELYPGSGGVIFQPAESSVDARFPSIQISRREGKAEPDNSGTSLQRSSDTLRSPSSSGWSIRALLKRLFSR